MPSDAAPLQLVVSPEDSHSRLDAFLAGRLPQHSRVKLRRLITAGSVTVDGCHCKAAYRLKEGQTVQIRFPEAPPEGPQPEEIPLEILYEDRWLAAVNKPAGMVVHPSKGHWSGTLTAALAYHFQQLSSIGGPARPGIVHRLDRETSGVMVVAKTDPTHLALSAQFESRTAQKEYLALVRSVPDRDCDVIEAPLGVHPHQREKMAIRAGHKTSREARTMYEVQERFEGYAALRVFPKTGRTHQIRVHLAHIGCPVLCDRLYGGHAQMRRAGLCPGADQSALLKRHALHARRLSLTHPATGAPLKFEAPIPDDMAALLTLLRQQQL